MGLRYTRMKIFHFSEKLESLSRETATILPPVNVRIKPTNACNHSCHYCAYKAEHLQLGRDMNSHDFIPKSKMLEIIDDLGEMGVKAVTFSGGGDPFCYQFLQETVDKTIEQKLKFAALTNGSRLEGTLAETFAHHGSWLRVSMDGWDNDSYSHYRGCPDGEFSRIMRNMESFSKLGGQCHLGVSIVVDMLNYNHLVGLIGSLKAAGVSNVKISPCIVSNSGSENNCYQQPIFAAVKEQIAAAVIAYADHDFEIFDSYHTQLESFNKSYNWCPYIQIAPVIGADLNVYSCHDKAYNLEHGVIGSIRDIRFSDLWNWDKGKFFKINPSQVCDHHCVVDSSNRQILEFLDADLEHLDFV